MTGPLKPRAVHDARGAFGFVPLGQAFGAGAAEAGAVGLRLALGLGAGLGLAGQAQVDDFGHGFSLPPDR